MGVPKLPPPPAILGGMKRPQISLRTMLWIVALVAILAGWAADRHRLKVRQSELSTELSEANARADMFEVRTNMLLERRRLYSRETAMRAILERNKKTP